MTLAEALGNLTFPASYRQLTPRILSQPTANALPGSEDIIGERLREAGWQT